MSSSRKSSIGDSKVEVDREFSINAILYTAGSSIVMYVPKFTAFQVGVRRC